MTGIRTAAVDLDLYAIAWLAGGPRRVVETAVVALVDSGRVRAGRPTGELHVVAARPRHAVEAAVLDAVGDRGRRTVEGVYWRVRSDARLAGVGSRLEEAGLLARGAGDPSARRRAWEPTRTRAGRRALRAVRRDLPPHLVGGGTEALLVALSGPGAMTDPDLRAVVFDPPRPALPPVPRRERAPVPFSDGRGGGYVAGGFGGYAAFGGGGGDCGGGGDGGGGC
ncbi:TIGR04222 domain-containing membrane protein [Geodermatophilus sp. SYSU D00742]